MLPDTVHTELLRSRPMSHLLLLDICQGGGLKLMAIQVQAYLHLRSVEIDYYGTKTMHTLNYKTCFSRLARNSFDFPGFSKGHLWTMIVRLSRHAFHGVLITLYRPQNDLGF